MILLYKRTSPRLKDITAKVPWLAPVEPITFPDLQAQLGPELQYDFRTLMSKRMFVLRDSWESLVETDEFFIRRWAKRGWATDFGSIPGAAESVEKRDDRKKLIGYLNHDIDFGTHDLSVEFSGCQLYQTARRMGSGKLSCWWVWRAVTSDLAHEIYDSAQPEYEKKWAGVELIPKGECHVEQARRLIG